MADETAHAVRITIGIAIKDAVEPTEESSDRKSTRLNSSHSQISYAVFCLKKKKNNDNHACTRTPHSHTHTTHYVPHLTHHSGTQRSPRRPYCVSVPRSTRDQVSTAYVDRA